MADNATPIQIVVTNAEGVWATVIAVPDPSSSPEEGSEPKLVYGIGGLTVDKISENQFRDFQGAIWTIDQRMS